MYVYSLKGHGPSQSIESGARVSIESVMKTVRPRPLCPVCPEHGPFKKFPVDAVNDGDHIRFPTKHRHKKSQRRRIQMGASRVCAHSHRTARVKSQSKAWRSSSSSVDKLKLDGVARVEVVRAARYGYTMLFCEPNMQSENESVSLFTARKGWPVPWPEGLVSACCAEREE